jgi:hypothetical protein
LSEFEHLADVEPVGELSLKGFARPISVYSIGALKP